MVYHERYLTVGRARAVEAGAIFRPIDKGATVRASRPMCRSVANIVGLCRARRVRCQHVFGPFAAGRLLDLCGGEGRVNLQDDRCIPA